jgi:hypothetical protein
MAKIKTVIKKTLNGKPATQKNVTLEDDYFASIVEAGKLKYDSFSTYVRKLIDADMEKACEQTA